MVPAAQAEGTLAAGASADGAADGALGGEAVAGGGLRATAGDQAQPEAEGTLTAGASADSAADGTIGGETVAGGGTSAAAGDQAQPEAQQGPWSQVMFQVGMVWLAMNMAARVFAPPPPPQAALVSPPGTSGGGAGLGAEGGEHVALPRTSPKVANLYGPSEECDLWVHYSADNRTFSRGASLFNTTLAEADGFVQLWHAKVSYSADAPVQSVNVSVGPLPQSVLDGTETPHIHATLIRSRVLATVGADAVPDLETVVRSLPLTARLKQLDVAAGAGSLFAGSAEGDSSGNRSRAEVHYAKTKLDVRPVVDHTVHDVTTLGQGPFRHVNAFPTDGVYQPVLYLSDFWLLEKDYLELNSSMAGQQITLNLTYQVASLMAWSMQAQMVEQWSSQGQMGITDPQRDSFMLKRLMIDTNPYFLGFSAAFVILHMLFSMLAFKSDMQFWHNNKSMTGLSARSMGISFTCHLITALYLLDSNETSKLILFELFLSLALEFWKLKKAVKISLKPSFPFVSFGGQDGYGQKGTDRYDEEAIRYMVALIAPLFIGYVIRSALYDKHRGWYSFLIGSAAGGVYTFGFVMMTPQLYINYKLQSVEHLPWRALTYKAMNTFVDDIFAFLIDMPTMHRLSCFRDDLVFFIYLYQRWKYSVDKSRPVVL